MLYQKVGVIALAAGISLTSVCSATLMRFDLKVGNVLEENLSRVHFKAGGNDFGGVIARDQTEDVADTGERTVQTNNGKGMNCTRQVRGLYYNSQRGERLRPLDEKTMTALGYGSLGLTGGLYTSCATSGEDNKDSYGIYGYIEHTFNNHNYELLAGVEYANAAQNSVKDGSPLAPTLQRLGNKYPLGLIYDHNGGIGFVGCTFNSLSTRPSISGTITNIIEAINTSGVNNFFTIENGEPKPIDTRFVELNCGDAGLAIDQLLLLKIQGIVGMSNEVGSDYENLAGNEADSKTQYFSTVNLNNATLVNLAKQRAETLCRGRWTNTLTAKDGVICLDLEKKEKGFLISAIGSVSSQDKTSNTLIARNGTLVLRGKMNPSDAPLDIFIDKGKLIFEWAQPNDRIDFNINAFPVSQAGGSGVAAGKFLKGNFIINGLVGVTGNNQPPENAPRFFIHGKFTSLNTYAANLANNRVSQLKTLLGDNSIAIKDIDLKDVFSRRCNLYTGTMIGTDMSECPNLLTGANAQKVDFYSAPLVIIGQEYPSKLLQ